MAEWTAHRIYCLRGTYLQLSEDAAGGWFIVDYRRSSVTLSRALTLPMAKRVAEQLVERSPRLRKPL